MSERQSRRASLVEAVVNTAAGFVFSFAIQKILNHAYDVEMSNSTAAWFVFWFTVASIARSYVIRRLWTNEWWKVPVQKWRRRKVRKWALRQLKREANYYGPDADPKARETARKVLRERS